jgi:hypothetical protein
MPITNIANGETGSSVRGKLNSAIALVNAFETYQPRGLPLAQALVFDSAAVVYQRTNVTGSLVFSANTTGAITGSVAVLELVATGGTAPDFSEFKALNGSSGWDNRSGIINLVMVYYFGPGSIWVTIAQEEGQVPIDIVAPTLVSAVIPNAAPSTVVLTFSEALAVRATPASSFAISGKTITGFAQSGSTVTLTVSAPFLAGDAATLSYTPPGANPLADVAGNAVAAISASAITNNIVSTIPASLTFPDENRITVDVSGTAPDLIYTGTGTSWNSRMRSAESIPENEDGWVMVRQPTLGGTINVGLTENSAPLGDLYTNTTTFAGTHLHPGGFYYADNVLTTTAGAANDSFRVKRTGGVITAERRPSGATDWTVFFTFPGISTAELFANVTFTFTSTSVARDVQGVGFS